MKRNIYFYVVFFAVILYSCKDASIEKDKSNQTAENKVTENVLFTGKTVYSKILRTDTKILGYSSQKDNSLSKEFLEILDETTSQLDSTNSAMKVKGFGAVSLTVNGINLSDLSNNIPSGLQRIKAAAPVLYGQNVSFTLSRNIPQNIKGSQKSKSSILSDTTVTMYVPELVEISSPKVETSKDLMPYCFYKDFVLKWNTDLKNENGLVVVVEWSGMYVTGQKENKYVRNRNNFVQHTLYEVIRSGTILSNWKEKQLDPIETEVSINQTFFHIQVKIKTGESKSNSIGATFDIDKERGISQLIYSYMNTPKSGVRHRSEIHYGTTTLSFEGFNVVNLEGEYWTSRETTGEIHLKRK